MCEVTVHQSKKPSYRKGNQKFNVYLHNDIYTYYKFKLKDGNLLPYYDQVFHNISYNIRDLKSTIDLGTIYEILLKHFDDL